GPPAPPVVPAANPSAALDHVRPPPPPTWLKAHCMRATSAQVSWTIGLLPAVDPSLSLMHRLLAMRYFPPEAVNDHCWLAFVPSPQPHCCSCRPDVVAQDGTSTQRPLPTLTRVCAAMRHCCRAAVASQALCCSSAPLSTDPP